MNIEPWPAGRLFLSGTKLQDPMLTEDHQRELVAYIWKMKPGLIREVVCVKCPGVNNGNTSP